MADEAVQKEVIPGRKKKREDEFEDVVSTLSPETQRRIRAPRPEPPPPSPPPLPRYGGTPEADVAPGNLREADTELRRGGYTRGSRFGDRILRLFGAKRKE